MKFTLTAPEMGWLHKRISLLVAKLGEQKKVSRHLVKLMRKMEGPRTHISLSKAERETTHQVLDYVFGLMANQAVLHPDYELVKGMKEKLS